MSFRPQVRILPCPLPTLPPSPARTHSQRSAWTTTSPRRQTQLSFATSYVSSQSPTLNPVTVPTQFQSVQLPPLLVHPYRESSMTTHPPPISWAEMIPYNPYRCSPPPKTPRPVPAQLPPRVLLSAGTQFPNPPTQQEREPRRHCSPSPPKPRAGGSPSPRGPDCRREPRAPTPAASLPQLRPRRAPAPPRSPRWAAGLSRGLFRGPRGDAALAAPGSGPAQLSLQPGRTAPTRQRQPRDGDAAPTLAPCPLPVHPASRPALSASHPPARLPSVRTAKRPHQCPLSVPRPGSPKDPALSSVAAETSLSQLAPAAPRPASALSLGPYLSIKPAANPRSWSF
ncbi:proline-rich protein 36-like [Saccopteryx bilineata]|uniref:proline-rich protein 36-like n=1 Tax=Saccopteryx bilineata TaxID=59482 RepID=UPI00338F3C27